MAKRAFEYRHLFESKKISKLIKILLSIVVMVIGYGFMKL